MRSLSRATTKTTSVAGSVFGWRDWLIAFMLVLACVQCIRADFFMSESSLNWHEYAIGGEMMPYQGRIGMMPILRWAGESPFMQHFAAAYARTIAVGSIRFEPITPEKFVSMLVGMVSMFATMLGAFWFSRRRRIEPWWLGNVLVVAIVAVSTVMRATQNYWYPYDLPHMALFGLAMIFALEGYWVATLLCFAVDVPMRETSIFLLLLTGPLLYRQLAGKPRQVMMTAGMLLGMLLFWLAIRVPIARRFAHNVNQISPRKEQNLHDILFPHHWPQLFSAGGYLVFFIWFERRRLDEDERLLLYCSALCVPVVLFFGVWTETRVWLEWTLPLSVMAATETMRWVRDRFGAAGNAEA